MALEPFDGGPTSGAEGVGPQQVGKILIFVNPHWMGNDLSVEQNEQGQLVNIDPEQLRTSLNSLGLVVNPNGTLTVDTLKARNIEVEKIQIKAQGTGEIYCTWLDSNGELVKVKGECDGQLLNQVKQQAPGQTEPSDTPQDEGTDQQESAEGANEGNTADEELITTDSSSAEISGEPESELIEVTSEPEQPVVE